jgi:hypothetical protein
MAERRHRMPFDSRDVFFPTSSTCVSMTGRELSARRAALPGHAPHTSANAARAIRPVAEHSIVFRRCMWVGPHPQEAVSAPRAAAASPQSGVLSAAAAAMAAHTRERPGADGHRAADL